MRYPILPLNKIVDRDSLNCPACAGEFLQVRHHSVLALRDFGDFDESPNFQLIQSILGLHFDLRALSWHSAPALNTPA